VVTSNILSNPRPNDPARDRHRNVLDRIAAYDLVDCLEVKRPRTALPECPCGRGRGCRHTWTKRVKGKAIAYQDDYLFASKRFARRLESCVALPFTKDSPSDHTPIVAVFRT
jgi:exonuclease III